MWTLALPFGIYPQDRGLTLHGSWDGQEYRYSGVFTVAGEPAPSPFSIRFDPLSIPRIESQPWRGTRTSAAATGCAI